MKARKKLSAILLCIALLLSALPVTAFVAASGTDCTVSDCSGTYVNGFCSVCDDYMAATLNSDGYYEISNAGQLYWFAGLVNGTLSDVAQNSSANGRLTADISVNHDVLKADGTLNGDGDNFRVWTPIGLCSPEESRYTGTFNGCSHKISGLYYSAVSEYSQWIGLFGYIQGAKITDITLEESYFSGDSGIGGLIGCGIDATASGLHNSATVKGQNTVGGVAGSFNGNVKNCANSGLIIAEPGSPLNNVVGGVIGEFYCINGYTYSIENCRNSGKITVAYECDVGYVGGVTGEVSSMYSKSGTGKTNKATIKNCYNTGEIVIGATEGDIYVGGITGYAYTYVYSNKTVLNIENCYSNSVYSYDKTNTKIVTAGLVGYAYAHTGIREKQTSSIYLNNCCYPSGMTDIAIKKTTNIVCTINTSGLSPKNDEEFASGQVAYFLNGSKSNGVWKQTLGDGGDKSPNFTGAAVYPMQQSGGCELVATKYSNTENATYIGEHSYKNGYCACKAREEAILNTDNFYEISNAGQLFDFAERVNNGNTAINGKLTADIDLESKEWTAIGTEAKPYTGTFDGCQKKISGLSITAESDFQGLFGAVSGGTVKNLTLNGKIDITAKINNVGGITGYAKNKATVENVAVDMTITDFRTDIDATSTDNRLTHIGGVVASLENSTLKNAVFSGKITVQVGSSVGGVVGIASSYSTINGCTNSGTATSGGNSAHVGGITGDGATGTHVIYCINYGNVTSGGADCIGGVVAYANENSKIESCGNVGKVTCEDSNGGYIGGVLGYINNNGFGSLKNCYNYGSVVSNSGSANHPGAIVGWCRNSNVSMFGNNYYLEANGIGASGGTAVPNAYAKNSEAFENGEVTYLLNGSKTEGKLSWFQTLGIDKTPVFSGKTVFNNSNNGYYNAEAGDINGDGDVNILDLVRMKKNLAAESTAEDMDLNADKSVNSLDLSCLRKFLLGLFTFK